MIILTDKGYIIPTKDTMMNEEMLIIGKESYKIVQKYEHVYEIIDYGDLVYTKDRFGLIKAHAILRDRYDMFKLDRWLKHNKDKIYCIYKPSEEGFKLVYRS